jgi:hypothetical protein
LTNVGTVPGFPCHDQSAAQVTSKPETMLQLDIRIIGGGPRVSATRARRRFAEQRPEG